MLKKIRQVTALLFFVLLTLLFLDFTGTLHKWFGWLAQVQLFPAILAVNIGVIIAVFLLTLFFGRIYCSVICPLGVMQDGISRFANRWKKKVNRRFHFAPAKSWIRYIVLTLFVLCFIFSVNVVVSILEPYSAYGRIVSQIFAPFYKWGNNVFAYIAEQRDSYTFYSVDVWLASGITLVVAIATLIIVGVFAWRNGRSYCNTICPVGTALGFVSRFSIFRPTFADTEKCISCKQCEYKCKSSCIDSKKQSIDQSRCVSCFNCIDACKQGGIKYTFCRTSSVKPQPVVAETSEISTDKKTISRRNALTIIGAVAVAGTVKAQQVHLDGGLADLVAKKVPQRKTPIVPPGAGSLRNFSRKCTACQLCVTSCPNQILRPSSKLDRFMQPEMSFERGYCRPECVECSQVCPTGAITRITPAEKSALSIGTAHWIKENCVALRDEVTCTICERHCPTGAVMLISRSENGAIRTPVIDTSMCIGCGACENLCPARPFSAIYVEGNQVHHNI
jgi:ferredoxin